MMQVMEPVTLKPCPFCGAKLSPKECVGWKNDIIVHYFHPGVVTDEECLLSGKGYSVSDLAKWNTRAQADRSPQGGDHEDGRHAEHESAVPEGNASK